MPSLKRLLEETAVYRPRVVANNGCSHVVYNDVRLLEKGQSDLSGKVLYVGYASWAVSIREWADRSAFFFIKDCDLDRQFQEALPANAALVEYPAGTDLGGLYNKIKEVFGEEWHNLNNSLSLLQSLLYYRDLDELAEKAAAMLKNPVIIMDVSHTVLAHSTSIDFDDDIWRQHLEMRAFSFEYSAVIQRFYAAHDKSIPRDNTPYMVKTDKSPARRLVSKLYANGTHLGYFVTLEANRNFDSIDLNFYRLVGDVVANILNSDRNLYIEKGYPNYESIFIDLVDGYFANRSAFLRSIQGTELTRKTVYQVLCIELYNYSFDNPTDNFLKRSLDSILGRNWSFYFNGYIVAIVDVRGNEFTGIGERNELERLLTGHSLRAGLSCVFDDLYCLSQYYCQGLRALEISKQLHLPGSLFDYERCKFYDLILSIQKQERINERDLKQFCHSTIIKMQEYDQRHSTEYLNTLWAYLNSNKNIARTARRLFVHKNTAAYRLRKIEQLFHINLDDDFMLFMLYYSYLMLQIAD